MADSCCKSETACREPPALVLPDQLVRAVPAATCGTAEDTCCPKGVPVFDGVNPRYKRILWTVIGINGAMFVGEMVAGQLAGSQALKADALDFLADTVTYGLSLAVIGASLRTRATAALAKGVSLSLMRSECSARPSIRRSSSTCRKLKLWARSVCWRWRPTSPRCHDSIQYLRKKHGGGKKQRDFRIGFPHPTCRRRRLRSARDLKPIFADRLPLSNS